MSFIFLPGTALADEEEGRTRASPGYKEAACCRSCCVSQFTPQHTNSSLGHTTFFSIPNELVLLCSSHLDIASAYSLSQASSTFHTLLSGQFKGVRKEILFCAAAQTGSVDLVRWLLQRFGCRKSEAQFLLSGVATGRISHCNF